MCPAFPGSKLISLYLDANTLTLRRFTESAAVQAVDLGPGSKVCTHGQVKVCTVRVHISTLATGVGSFGSGLGVGGAQNKVVKETFFFNSYPIATGVVSSVFSFLFEFIVTVKIMYLYNVARVINIKTS